MGGFTARTKISLWAGLLLVAGLIGLRLSRPGEPPVKLAFLCYTNQGRTAVLSLTNGLDSGLLAVGGNNSLLGEAGGRSATVLHVGNGWDPSSAPQRVEVVCIATPSRLRRLFMIARRSLGLTNHFLVFTLSVDLPPVLPSAEAR